MIFLKITMANESNIKVASINDRMTLSNDILIVDDEIPNLKLLTQLLTQAGHLVRAAERPQLAINAALAHPPALILLDVKMPEMDGFEVCRRLKKDERTRDIPVIFISALQDAEDKVRGFEAGGVDFISKPFQEEEVLARVRTHMALRNLQLNMEEMVAKRTAELAESKASLEEAQQLARIGSWTWDPKTDTVTWSKSLYEIFGLDPKKDPPSYEMHPSIYTPESWEKLNQAVTRALNEGQSYELELDIVRPDGLIRHTVTRGNVTKSDDGSVVRLFGVARDITEHKRATEELVKSEAKYRDLVDNSLVGVFNSSLDGQLLFVNDALARMYDFENPEQMMAEGSLGRWADPKQREQLMSLLREHGGVDNFEAETVTATGRHNHVLFSVKLEGEVLSGMVMDITKRRQAEKRTLAHQEKLRAMASELIIVEERERKRIAGDLHDGAAQSLGLARMQLAEVAEAVAGSEPGNILGEASRQIRRAVEQIRGILIDLSSPALHEMGLAAGLSEWWDEHIRDKRGLKVEFLDECGNVDLADEMRLFLFRSVCELLTNVVKHARAQRVCVNMTCAGPTLRIVVEDDGLGFDPASVDTLPARSGGFGLFSITERMADLGGSLEMVSAPGKGCRAILAVPIEFAGQRLAQ